MISINTRILGKRVTGVQRYLTEILSRLSVPHRKLAPPVNLQGLAGHLWEQTALPALAGDSILWSPSQSGPMWRERQVITVHDLAPLELPQYLSPAFARWYSVMMPRAIRSARRIIAVSAFTADRLRNVLSVPTEKISVVHEAVDHSRFRVSSAADVERALARYQAPSATYVLSVCTLERRKNLAKLLEAWSAIQERVPDAWLLLSGSFGDRHVFGTTEVTLPPRVKTLGYVADEDLPHLYSGCQAFAYVSEYEGFGLPVLEAMACGAPVLTSAGTSTEEIAKGAAVLVDPRSVDDIAQHLRALLTERALREERKQAGVEVAKTYAWERAARETEEILQSL
ncbi:MAG TPA: glycosyltransferase family 1 protein [Nevskiaceae bacterium]|nr:glycosyltransferase family 1 protein [Nevskiaceae bacterium]